MKKFLTEMLYFNVLSKALKVINVFDFSFDLSFIYLNAFDLRELSFI